MDLLPNEILSKIASYLCLQSLGRFSKVSNRFRLISTEIITKKCLKLAWRLDIFFPPREIPEGILILDYNRGKRKTLSQHKFKKYRKISLVNKGISRELLDSYPTFKLPLDFWDFPEGNTKKESSVIDMIW